MLDSQIVEFMSMSVPEGELSIISLGSDPASEKYISIKKKYCENRGIRCGVYKIDPRLEDQHILKKILSIVSNPAVSGVIIQLPLPRPSLNTCLRLIPIEKDIDSISPASMESFYAGKPLLLPPVIRALDLFLSETEKKSSSGNLSACVIGEGYLVGKPAAQYLQTKNYAVSVINDYRAGQKINADIVILSAGVPNLVKGEDMSEGCDVVDFGSSVVDGVTTGDLDLNSQTEHLGLVSPSPGGVGPLVVRYLIMNYLGI
mgnify:CR=1 FL=1